MNTDRYKQQHNDIMASVTDLRALIQAGIAAHADDIAQLIIAMSTSIKFHLAAEDAVLYPALRAANDPATVGLSRKYQDEMQGISRVYADFARKWRVGTQVAAAPEAFRAEANAVFKALHDRIQKENRELYPAAERL